jgi:hypothetical protein
MENDITLKYKDLCNTDCRDHEIKIHPETCLSQILLNHNSNKSENLYNWITNNSEYTFKESLLEWLKTYYPYSNNTENYILPIATSNTLGGVKIGNNLTIDENGVLSVNTSKNAEYNFSENFTIIDNTVDINVADYKQLGISQLSFQTHFKLTDFSNDNITNINNQYIFRVGKAIDNSLGVIIPKELFNSSLPLADTPEGNGIGALCVARKNNDISDYTNTGRLCSLELDANNVGCVRIPSLPQASVTNLGGIKISSQQNNDTKIDYVYYEDRTNLGVHITEDGRAFVNISLNTENTNDTNILIIKDDLDESTNIALIKDDTNTYLSIPNLLRKDRFPLAYKESLEIFVTLGDDEKNKKALVQGIALPENYSIHGVNSNFKKFNDNNTDPVPIFIHDVLKGTILCNPEAVIEEQYYTVKLKITRIDNNTASPFYYIEINAGEETSYTKNNENTSE